MFGLLIAYLSGSTAGNACCPIKRIRLQCVPRAGLYSLSYRFSNDFFSSVVRPERPAGGARGAVHLAASKPRDDTRASDTRAGGAAGARRTFVNGYTLKV